MTDSISDLRAAIHYDPETGIMVWKERDHPSLKFMTGKEIGSDHRGYLRFKHMDEWLFVHRVAWAIHYGVWPRDQIDHINGVRSDNRICNLRECSNRMNCANRPKPQGKYFSDFKGVGFDERRGRWSARCGGKRVGTFSSEVEAARAYDAAAVSMYGAFARLNFAEGE